MATEPPGQDSLQIRTERKITFEGTIGDVLLPKDYIDFLLVSDGAALRDRGSWFLARFTGGTLIAEIEWLGGIDNAMGGTWKLYIYPDPEKNMVAEGFIDIGYAEPGPSCGWTTDFEQLQCRRHRRVTWLGCGWTTDFEQLQSR